jgi:hypothetical protein
MGHPSNQILSSLTLQHPNARGRHGMQAEFSDQFHENEDIHGPCMLRECVAAGRQET